MSYKNMPDISPKGEAQNFEMNGLKFSLEKKLYKKLIIMCNRISKKHPTLDACLINDGYEGEGKTNTSLVESIIINGMLNTSIHLFFKTSSCIKFAQSTERKIIILDEPAFESLSTDTATTLNKDFLRLTSTMRKKRHFFIINFAKFWKFPDFLVVDRALGMVHMYSNNGKDPGRFIYIRKKNLEQLWNDKKKANKRSYKRLKSFGGRMPYLMEEIFAKFNINVESVAHATIDDYDREKDKAIGSIGGERLSKTQMKDILKLLILRKKVSQLWMRINIPQVELAQQLGVNSRRLQEWARIDLENINYGEIAQNLKEEGVRE